MLQILTRRDKGQGLTSRLRTRLIDLDHQTRPVIDVVLRSRFRMGLFGWSFVACVILPVLFSFLYLALVASSEYVSEAKFTIRTAGENKSSLISDAVSNVSASMNMG